MEERRLIEESFPVREVSKESAEEKGIRRGHISALHLWWARRPLAASRATIYAALVPCDNRKDRLKQQNEFVFKLSKWTNSNNKDILERARGDIERANRGEAPKVLDPFAGGGSIPLEALRLGCQTYASDYNPVASLVLKCEMEYPEQYGVHGSKKESNIWMNIERLQNDVRRWGGWVQKEAERELGMLYPRDDDGSILMGYFWARTIICQNPSCNAETPLIRQYWLSKKGSQRVALYPYVENNEVKFKIVGDGHNPIPKGFNPEKGNISRAVSVCLVCGSTTADTTTRRLFAEGKSGAVMTAVVLRRKGVAGKRFRIATGKDVEVFTKAEDLLNKKRKLLTDELGLDPVPDEPTPEGEGSGAERGFAVRRYNMKAWGDLFNTRQKLAMITFSQIIRNSYQKMLAEGVHNEDARVLVTYLALAFDKLADASTVLCRWKPGTVQVVPTLGGRQALPMLWDYVEMNPISGIGHSWTNTIEVMLDSFRILEAIPNVANVKHASATALPFPDGFFDAVITDPPYYDNVPYSYLSDFFYVWLKRTIGFLYPDLFVTPLTPKSDEIVTYSRGGSFEAGKQFFETKLRDAFLEINRVLKPGGISIVVFAHKSTAGWETLVNSLLDSSLVVSGAWPIHTEMTGRLMSLENASLASSIYMVTRKSPRVRVGFYKEVRDSLEKHLATKLDRMWGEGISGADFLIAAIGSAIEVFGKYEKVIDDEGKAVSAERMLEDVRKIVTNYAVKQVLHNGFSGEISPLTRFYVLWRWAYGETMVDFDDARKLAQGVGIDLAREWNKGFIRKSKEFIEVLGPEDRDLDSLQGSTELIDVLHRTLRLWKKGKFDEATKDLSESGYGKSDVFYRVSQAISESLPPESGERKLLEGFLVGKERITERVSKEAGQTRLFE